MFKLQLVMMIYSSLTSVNVYLVIKCQMNVLFVKVFSRRKKTINRTCFHFQQKKDANECEITPNVCEHKCINVQGSYYVRGNESLCIKSVSVVFMSRRLSIKF